ncbi:hypothetical protein [Psychrobacter sp. S1-30-MNA-CIBAN-0213]|uniref:hypothetical protein n=1 Tax=Psychrobacter sp. S1-30-MNA-CIBAN-0213 TaxID=3140456 RepID=UPI00332A0D48
MYNRVREDERAYKLMYKTFELSLSKPTNSQIVSTILADEDCDRDQSENNFYFLDRVEDVIFTFLKRNELEYEKYNNFENKCECECDYDCECKINDFIIPAFHNLAFKFEHYLNDDSLINHILEEYNKEERERFLSRNLLGIFNLMLYKGLAYLAFEHGFYEVSCWHHEVAIMIYGSAVANERFNPSDYIESELSIRNKKASDARWQPHREKRAKRKKQYLEIMKERGFSTYTDTATYIKQHIHTGSTPSFNTVCRLLSEADKGGFS